MRSRKRSLATILTQFHHSTLLYVDGFFPSSRGDVGAVMYLTVLNAQYDYAMLFWAVNWRCGGLDGRKCPSTLAGVRR
jgi:hypothetical protein